MERSLSLVLDEQCQISLTLERMDTKELDQFIQKNFSDSDEIRKKYADKIDPYLLAHKDFLDRVYRDTGRKYNGSIVITELQDDLSVERKKVLYKKDIIIFRKITKNKKYMLQLENRDYINYRSALKDNKPYRRIFLDYYASELRFRSTSESKFNKVTGQWRNALKKSYYYYEYVRLVLKDYKNRYKELKLDSPDVIYSKYLQGRPTILEKDDLKDEIESLESIQAGDKFERDLLLHMDDYDDEPARFKTGADEDGYPGDLENHGIDYYRVGDTDDSEIETGKILSLNNGNYKMYMDEN